MVLRAASVALFLAWAFPLPAMDQVTFHQDGKTIEATGRVLVSAQDGGLALLARDGAIWLIPPDEQVKRLSDSRPFEPLAHDELAKQMLSELPKGFQTLSTAHYLICFDTSREYAKWCGSLFEKLYGAFTNYWSRKGFDLVEPEFPLVAIVFADKQAYLKYSRSDLGEAGEAVIGYYGMTTNRMVMYDLTGVAAQDRGRISTAAQINQILSQPDAMRTVSTIVHEATHQIAFNCGLHTRLSDCPRWFCEGIAEYFEAPDLRSAKGWRAIGNVNESRLEQFGQFRPARPGNSLETLIRDDTRFTDPKQAIHAYAEAWALTYFLINQRPKEYVAYLKTLSAKKTLLHDDPSQRIDEFRKAFGELPDVEKEFLRYMTRGR